MVMDTWESVVDRCLVDVREDAAEELELQAAEIRAGRVTSLCVSWSGFEPLTVEYASDAQGKTSVIAGERVLP